MGKLFGKWVLALAVGVTGGALIVEDVEARRLGGGRTVGAQRNITNAQPANPPARQAQQAPQQGQQAAAAAPAGGSKWMPILGGLAIGGMLGALFANGGLGGLLLLALVAVAVFFLFRMLASQAATQRPAQLAGAGGHAFQPQQAPLGGGSAPAARVPAGFDVEGFLRGAKQNFLKLQMANDAARVEEIREFTTPALFEALSADLGGGQHTEVQGLQADLLEVVTEGDTHWASVRFSGTVGEAPGAAPEAFSEVWNLAKPVDGSSGWLLAGIQQMH